jgi:hypothetical protein
MQEGDLMVLAASIDIVAGGTGATIATPTGWTSRGNIASSFTRQQMFTKFYDGSEAMPAINGSTRTWIAAFRGVDPVTPMDANPTTGTAFANPAVVAAPVTVTEKAMVVGCGCASQGRGVNSVSGGTLLGSASGIDPCAAFGYYVKDPAGASNFSVSLSSAPNGWAAVVIALRPA